jgi:rubrerythrin
MLQKRADCRGRDCVYTRVVCCTDGTFNRRAEVEKRVARMRSMTNDELKDAMEKLKSSDDWIFPLELEWERRKHVATAFNLTSTFVKNVADRLTQWKMSMTQVKRCRACVSVIGPMHLDEMCHRCGMGAWDDVVIYRCRACGWLTHADCLPMAQTSQWNDILNTCVVSKMASDETVCARVHRWLADVLLDAIVSRRFGGVLFDTLNWIWIEVK